MFPEAYCVDPKVLKLIPKIKKLVYDPSPAPILFYFRIKRSNSMLVTMMIRVVVLIETHYI